MVWNVTAEHSFEDAIDLVIAELTVELIFDITATCYHGDLSVGQEYIEVDTVTATLRPFPFGVHLFQPEDLANLIGQSAVDALAEAAAKDWLDNASDDDLAGSYGEAA